MLYFFPKSWFAQIVPEESVTWFAFVQSVHLPKLLTNHVASCCGVIYAAGRDESSAQNVTQWVTTKECYVVQYCCIPIITFVNGHASKHLNELCLLSPQYTHKYKWCLLCLIIPISELETGRKDCLNPTRKLFDSQF